MQFDENDGLPSVVCSACLLQISKIHAFRQLAFESNTVLRTKFKPRPIKASENDVIYLLQQENDPDENEPESEIYAVIVDDENGIDLQVQSNDVELGLDESIEYEEFTEEDSQLTHKSSEHSGEPQFIDTIDTMQDAKSPNARNRRSRNDRNKKSYECDICGKVLSNHSSLKYHLQLHSDKTPYKCTECGEKFKTRNAFDGHMSTHAENRNKCEICGKTYRQAASLRSHMLTHANKKPFVCEICGKGTTQKSGYKKHMLLHSDVKSHACEFCGQLFRYKSNLLCHRRSHLDERNHACNVSEP